MGYVGYSFEAGRFETTSLEKYLQVREEIVTPDALKKIASIYSNEPLIIIASHLNQYKDIFDNTVRKIILIHLSDEAYDVRKCDLYLHPQLILILRNYEIFPLGFLLMHSMKWLYWLLKWSFSFWIKERNFSTNLKTIRHISLSRRYVIRQMRMALLVQKTKVKIICFPFNDTNFYFQGKSDKNIEKNIQVSFAGNIHSAERILASRVAHQLGYSHGYDGEWGPGRKGSLSPSEYVNLLKASHFCLCPNGHMNQDCFRFFEIIASGSLPIITKGSPYQPFSYYGNIYDVDPRLMVSTFNVDSVKALMESIPLIERKVILERLRNSVLEKNEIAKLNIATFFNAKDS